MINVSCCRNFSQLSLPSNSLITKLTFRSLFNCNCSQEMFACNCSCYFSHRCSCQLPRTSAGEIENVRERTRSGQHTHTHTHNTFQHKYSSGHCKVLYCSTKLFPNPVEFDRITQLCFMGKVSSKFTIIS